MNDLTSPPREAAAYRYRDARATRAAILEAAQLLFGRLGYDKASLRDIAAEAGSDVALIRRYFGGKEALFTEALKATFQPDTVRLWNRDTFAVDMANMMAEGQSEEEAQTSGFQFLLRAATSPTTAPLLNVAIQERYFEPISNWLGGEDAEIRARVLAATLIGFLVERLIRDKPLQGHGHEIFIAHATTTFQSLLSPTR